MKSILHNLSILLAATVLATGFASGQAALNGGGGVNMQNTGKISSTPVITSANAMTGALSWEQGPLLQGFVVPAAQLTGLTSAGGLVNYEDLLPLKLTKLQVMLGAPNAAPTGVGTLIDSTGIDTNSVITDAFQLITGAGLGKVLTSDASGVATWGTLPAAGSVGNAQTLSTSGNTLTISGAGGNSVTIPSPSVSLSGSTLMVGTNTVNLGSLNTDNQNLSLSGLNLGITNGTGVTLPTPTLSTSGGNLVVTTGGVTSTIPGSSIPTSNLYNADGTLTGPRTMTQGGNKLTFSGTGGVSLNSGPVAIGAASPDASALLDLTSTTGGLLAPRMTSTQRLAIPSPATGLLVYDTTANQFQYYNGSAWTPVSSSSATGTVTSVGTGTGLTGGPITSTGTISLANTAVTPGTYGSTTTIPTFTVDAQGRLTAASAVTVASPSLGVSGNTLTVGTNTVTLPAAGSAGNAQTLSVSGTTLTISGAGGNSVTIPSPAVSLSGTTLNVGGNTVNLASLNTDSQTLGLSGQTLSISGGNSVTLPAAGAAGNAQTLSVSGSTLTISGAGGNSITLPTSTDSQNLSLSGLALGISGGTGVTLPTPTLSVSGSNLVVTTGGVTSTLAASSIPTTNIYNANGTLTGARTVAMGTNSLNFTGTGWVSIGSANTSGHFSVVAPSSTGGGEDDITIATYGTPGAAYIMQSARGTEASPTNLSYGDSMGSLLFSGRANGNGSTSSSAVFATYRGDGTTALSDLNFTTSGSSGRLIIDSSGNISVAGGETLNFTGGNANCKINLYGGTFSSSTIQYFGFGIGSAELRYQVPTSCYHVFYVGQADGSDREGLRITGGGTNIMGTDGTNNLFISAGNGTVASPALGVGYTEGAVAFYTVTPGPVSVPYTTQSHLFGGRVIPLGDNNSNYTLGSSTRRWYAVYAANGTIQTSDVRAKTGIEDSAYGLSTVMQMRPVTYHWKTEPTQNKMVGFIAQEMEKIVPEAVVKPAKPEDLYGMKYETLLPVLTKAIQEQQQHIEKQDKKIEALEADKAKLAAKVTALETQTAEIAQIKAALEEMHKLVAGKVSASRIRQVVSNP